MTNNTNNEIPDELPTNLNSHELMDYIIENSEAPGINLNEPFTQEEMDEFFVRLKSEYNKEGFDIADLIVDTIVKKYVKKNWKQQSIWLVPEGYEYKGSK